MPAPARPLLHPGASIQSSGPVVDPAFTAAEFDVKAWINAALEAVPQQQQGGNLDSNNKSGPSPSSASQGDHKTSASVDASLDASLDLLQTPALDPVLDGKDRDDADSLVGTPPTLGSSGTNQQQQQATATTTTKSQTSLLTQHATTHLTKLHLLASQTSAALASTTQDMVKLLPRLTHELDQLRQETKVLQEGIRLVRSDVGTVESSDTVQALDRLKYLDLVKTRMEATHSALREAENWRNLEAEAQEILAKGDFSRAATRLSEAERSLVVYKNTNVEGDRMALLRVLKDQLEQQVMGKVKEALEQKDTVACQSLMAVFGLIGRQEKFQEYYISQRRAPLIAHWKELFKNIHQGPRTGATAPAPQSAGDSKDFVNALPKFYMDASNLLHDEFAWITSIFSDPSATIHNLVHDVFTHLDPTMQTALRDVARSQGDEGSLPLLIAAFVATESFGVRMERIVSQPLVGNLREHSPGSGGFSGRSRSGTLVQDAAQRDGRGVHLGRSSFSHEGLDIGSIHDPHEWAYILYEPFMVYQRDYGKLEGAHLRALLTTAIPAMATYPTKAAGSREISKASSHLVKIITNTNNIAFSLAEGAIGRCMRLTHGFGTPGLVDCLNGFFNNIMDRYTEILMECRQRSGLQIDGVTGEIKRQEDYGQDSRPSSRLGNKQSTPDDSEDSEGWDDDVNEQDQRLLHMGLRLIVLCRQLCLRLEQLDIKTKKSLRAVEHLIKSDANTHAGTSPDQGSSGSGLKMTAQPPNASIALLQQSNLNSYRLSEILEMVKKSAALEGQSGATMTNLGLISDGVSTLDRLSAETDLGLEPKAHHLFRQSHQRAVQLTKLCQRFIFDTLYIPLVRPLADVALLPCWTEEQGTPSDDLMGPRRIHQSTLGGTRTDVFRFRSGPSEYMEELLKQVVGLPLTLETYEGDAGLRFGIHALPYADRPADQREQSEEATRAEETALNSKEDNSEGLGVGESELESGSLTHGGQSPEGQTYEEEDDVAIMHRWITSLLRAAMHTLVERLYDPNLGQVKSSPATSTPPTSQRSRFGSPVPASSSPSGLSGPSFGGNARSASAKERHYLTRLSDSGAKQLELDLGHFVNTCLSSLAIEPTPSIQSLIKALGMSEAGLLMAMQQQREYLDNRPPQHKESGESSPSSSAEPSSIVIPGGPVLPTVLAIGDEESEEKQMEQEHKIFTWVAQLKGIATPQP
ncbi:conserved oligomeric Golgi complex subunit 7 [Entomortierella parvispora]|uniref:Conserved oligomeric Golgi complex subunit 7 n=1 Tax=Entomortierella parvispora TaxID=205924 RepID=A0A9P3M1U5_9FUNG|nr:conserved oligomeric Golgi complex subunit 7 [Entomortierella parvispora]